MKQILFSLILLKGLSFVLAAAPSNEEALSSYGFNVEGSPVENPRYGGQALILQNNTGMPLEHYRIYVMFVIDRNQPVMPGNVIERILKFSEAADEVILPVDHLAFTVIVYKGPFDEDMSARDVIFSENAEAVFMFDGEEVAESDLTVKLNVSTLTN